MGSLEHFRALASAGNLDDLRIALSAPEAVPCSHVCMDCPSNGVMPCPQTIEYLADQAARDGQLDVWSYLFDNCIHVQAGTISWDSIRHVTRRGDVVFADTFQLKQPGWANSMEPKGIRNETRSMTVVKLAVMRGQLDFVDHLINNCGCDINAGGLERSPVRMVLRMELEDDECMRRLEFLVKRGADVEGTGAVEAAEGVSRSSEIIGYLRARCNTTGESEA